MDTKNKIYAGVIVAGVAAMGYLMFMPEGVQFTSKSSASREGETIIQKPNPTPRQIIVSPEDLKAEIISRSPNQAEAKQHAELALSLRNQEMLTRRAELRTRQLEAELQEKKAREAITQLNDGDAKRLEQFTIQTSPTEDEARAPMFPQQIKAVASAPSNNNATEVAEMPLKNYRVVGIFKEGDTWVARITRGGSIERVKTGYILDGEVNVTVQEDHVLLERDGKQVPIYL